MELLSMGKHKMRKIIFEGIDCSGKTTIIKYLSEVLEDKNIKYKYIDEISESPLSGLLQSMLEKDPFFRLKKNFKTSIFETLLLMADNCFRDEYTNYGNRKEDFLIFDRDYLSILAYQGNIISKDYDNSDKLLKSLEEVLRFANPFSQKDTTLVYVSTPIDQCLKRIQQRDNLILSKNDQLFLETTKKSFETYLKDSPLKIIHLDGTKNPSYNANKLYELIKNEE
jgi:thymidylate kinase